MHTIIFNICIRYTLVHIEYPCLVGISIVCTGACPVLTIFTPQDSCFSLISYATCELLLYQDKLLFVLMNNDYVFTYFKFTFQHT